MILEKMEQIEAFTDAERQIIQYLLSHPTDILELSVRDLAKNSYTSSSTVNRLAGKLSGGMPFTRFKAALFAELHQTTSPLPESLDEITMNETIHSLVGKVAAAQTEAVERTRRALDYSALLRIARLLQQASPIYFFGFDDNLSIVRPYLSRMMTFGKQVILHDATNAQYYQALSIPAYPGSANISGLSRSSGEVSGKPRQKELPASLPAALLISRTGSNPKLVEIASILHDKQVPILLLTPVRNSPLGALASEWLELQHPVPAHSLNGLDSIDSLGNLGSIMFEASLQFVLTVLCSLMFSNNYESSRAILRQYGELYVQSTAPSASL